jgi:hypothetical protein
MRFDKTDSILASCKAASALKYYVKKCLPNDIACYLAGKKIIFKTIAKIIYILSTISLHIAFRILMKKAKKIIM